MSESISKELARLAKMTTGQQQAGAPSVLHLPRQEPVR